MDINEGMEQEFSQPDQRARLMKAYTRLSQEVAKRGREQLPSPIPAPAVEEQRKLVRAQKPTAEDRERLVQRFCKLYLSGEPETHSKMQRPGAAAKYYKRFHSLTAMEVAAHLEGRATFAAPLIGKDGFTREVALDIDQGGEVAITIGLQITTELGYSAYGLVSPAVARGHNGGHIRIPLADVAAPEQARLLAEQIKHEVVLRCALPEHVVEVYPTQKGLRLPFGVHTYTGKRGALLLQDGTRLELDEGEPLTTITHALTLLEALPPNNPETLPQPAPRVPAARVSVPNALQGAQNSSPIQDYNQRTDLLDWLISKGARVAATTRGGGYLLQCPCNNHTHHDARPSLEVQPARNLRHGTYVIIGHAPGCLFATQPGRIVDSFDAYCRWHGLSVKEALIQLYPR